MFDQPGCEQAFKKKNSIARHVRERHLDERRFECGYPGCEARFNRKNEHNNHVKRVHLGIKDNVKSKPSQMRVITSLGSTTTTINQPLDSVKASGFREKRSKKYFTCEFIGCEKQFTLKSSLIRHQKCHLNDGRTRYACPHESCESNFGRRDDLQKHIKKKHPLDLEMNEENKEKTDDIEHTENEEVRIGEESEVFDEDEDNLEANKDENEENDEQEEQLVLDNDTQSNQAVIKRWDLRGGRSGHDENEIEKI